MSKAQQPRYRHNDETHRDFPQVARDTLKRLRFYAWYVWRFFILRQCEPLIYGIAPTDRCNLAAVVMSPIPTVPT